MRSVCLSLALAFCVSSAVAQEKPDGPTNEKAQKTYKSAMDSLHNRGKDLALDDFKKADKQDGGHCLACQPQMIKYGVELAEWKTAERGAEEMVAKAQGERETALTCYQLAIVLIDEGVERHKDEFFTRAHDELTKALAAAPNFPDAVFSDGTARAFAPGRCRQSSF